MQQVSSTALDGLSRSWKSDGHLSSKSSIKGALRRSYVQYSLKKKRQWYRELILVLVFPIDVYIFTCGRVTGLRLCLAAFEVSDDQDKQQTFSQLRREWNPAARLL
jgi:hypothetical protein